MREGSDRWLVDGGYRLWLRLRAPGAELGEEAGYIPELDSPDRVDSQLERKLKSILSAVKTYLESPWMHTPRLTNTLLVNLLDTSSQALLAEARSHIPSGLASYYPYPWRYVVSLIQFLVFFAICSAAAAFLFRSDRFWSGMAVVAFMVLWYTRKILVSRRRGVYLRNQKQLVMTLGVVRSEIASRLYDPQEIERQLNKLDSAGLSIPSVARTLLHIAPKEHGASA
jgi:hypothetical protein